MIIRIIFQTEIIWNLHHKLGRTHFQKTFFQSLNWKVIKLQFNCIRLLHVMYSNGMIHLKSGNKKTENCCFLSNLMATYRIFETNINFLVSYFLFFEKSKKNKTIKNRRLVSLLFKSSLHPLFHVCNVYRVWRFLVQTLKKT